MASFVLGVVPPTPDELEDGDAVFFDAVDGMKGAM
jgi:hypothetical protein